MVQASEMGWVMAWWLWMRCARSVCTHTAERSQAGCVLKSAICARPSVFCLCACLPLCCPSACNVCLRCPSVVRLCHHLQRFTAMGFDNLPICMAKTQYSFSHDATLKGEQSMCCVVGTVESCVCVALSQLNACLRQTTALVTAQQSRVCGARRASLLAPIKGTVPHNRMAPELETAHKPCTLRMVYSFLPAPPQDRIPCAVALLSADNCCKWDPCHEQPFNPFLRPVYLSCLLLPVLSCAQARRAGSRCRSVTCVRLWVLASCTPWWAT